jgi:hypothetical protein
VIYLVFAASAGQSQTSQAGHELLVREIVKQSNEAVVQVVVFDQAGNELGLGSGFIVSADGKIVTNYHVIKDGNSAIAKLSNGSFFPIEGMLAANPDLDLAVLKVEGRKLPFLEFEPVTNLDVGDHVVAIGSPLGLEGTVSDGIVSAFRQETPNKNWIQTTAPVSHGNSGGPLLDMRGKVAGVITWGVSLQQGQNLNFAIPSDEVKSLLSTHGELVSIGAPAKNQSHESERAKSQSSTPSEISQVVVPAEQPAVRQLRYIADALKHCPPDKYKLIEGGIMASQGEIVHKGPPESVDWRVEYPFELNLAMIEYDFPNGVEQPTLSTLCNQPGMTKKECGKLWQTTLDEYKRTMDEYKRTSTHPLRFKYEFSVTPHGLEYRRGFSKTDQTAYEEWKTLETPDWCARWAISSVLPQYHWD